MYAHTQALRDRQWTGHRPAGGGDRDRDDRGGGRVNVPACEIHVTVTLVVAVVGAIVIERVAIVAAVTDVR
jgi:hypothetical protein